MKHVDNNQLVNTTRAHETHSQYHTEGMTNTEYDSKRYHMNRAPKHVARHHHMTECVELDSKRYGMEATQRKSSHRREQT